MLCEYSIKIDLIKVSKRNYLNKVNTTIKDDIEKV